MHTFLDVPPLGIPFVHWIEHITFGLLYVMFRFSTKVFYRGGPGFATDFLAVFWYTCLVCVGPLLKIKFEMIIAWHNGDQLFHCFRLRSTYSLIPHKVMILYCRLPCFDILNMILFFTQYFGTPILHRLSPWPYPFHFKNTTNWSN